MKVLILLASPRKQGNTQALIAPILAELEANGHDCTTHWLYDKVIHPCLGCCACQADFSDTYCVHQDDGQALFHDVLQSDLIVFATPIYSWYCTPPMKALLDRLVYVMNKYYGAKPGPSLWQGKSVALVTTCGYPAETGTDLLEEGLKRYCKHSKLHYWGMLAERHKNLRFPFMDAEKEHRATVFAQTLMEFMRPSLAEGEVAK